MDQNREQRIQQRAHEIWEREGQPSGREQEHWQRAEREIAAEDSPDLQRPEATVKSPESLAPPDQDASQAQEAVQALEAVSGRGRKRKG